MSAVSGFLAENRGRRVLVVTHSQADMDAAASALALASFFPSGAACVPDSLSSPGRRVAARFGGEVGKWKDVKARVSPEAVIIVDTNSLAMLPGMEDFVSGFGGGVCVIDHHTLRSDSVKPAASLIDESASSACEIVYELFRELNYPISSRVSELLLSGIVSDSSDLRGATTRTIEIVAYLLKRTRTPIAEIYDLAEGVPSRAERASVLESLAQARIVEAGGFIIATSQARSFEGVAADKLVSVGADYAFVAQKTRNEARISARCRASLCAGAGADVSSIMAEVGRLIGGSGGGHPAAAGADGPEVGKLEEALGLAAALAQKQVSRAKGGRG
ncbi:MAG: DHH family phosphoesterase [Candidatus ainarchaeum sp.]|nr:DHH family phosphoesterase [Candidatus ainarchaeum sp.]